MKTFTGTQITEYVNEHGWSGLSELFKKADGSLLLSLDEASFDKIRAGIESEIARLELDFKQNEKALATKKGPVYTRGAFLGMSGGAVAGGYMAYKGLKGEKHNERNGVRTNSGSAAMTTLHVAGTTGGGLVLGGMVQSMIDALPKGADHYRNQLQVLGNKIERLNEARKAMNCFEGHSNSSGFSAGR